MTWLTLAVLGLRIIAAILTNRKDAVQKHAQAIVDHVSAERDKAKAQAAEAEVKAAKATASDDKKVFTLDRSKRGGDTW